MRNRYAIVTLTLPSNEILDVDGRVVQVLKSALFDEGWSLTVLIEKESSL